MKNKLKLAQDLSAPNIYEESIVIDGVPVIMKARKPDFTPFNNLKHLDVEKIENEMLEIGVFQSFGNTFLGVAVVVNKVVIGIRLRKFKEQTSPFIAQSEKEVDELLKGKLKHSDFALRAMEYFGMANGTEAKAMGNVRAMIKRILDEDDNICCVMCCYQKDHEPPYCIMNCKEC